MYKIDENKNVFKQEYKNIDDVIKNLKEILKGEKVFEIKNGIEDLVFKGKQDKDFISPKIFPITRKVDSDAYLELMAKLERLRLQNNNHQIVENNNHQIVENNNHQIRKLDSLKDIVQDSKLVEFDVMDKKDNNLSIILQKNKDGGVNIYKIDKNNERMIFDRQYQNIDFVMKQLKESGIVNKFIKPEIYEANSEKGQKLMEKLERLRLQNNNHQIRKLDSLKDIVQDSKLVEFDVMDKKDNNLSIILQKNKDGGVNIYKIDKNNERMIFDRQYQNIDFVMKQLKESGIVNKFIKPEIYEANSEKGQELMAKLERLRLQNNNNQIVEATFAEAKNIVSEANKKNGENLFSQFDNTLNSSIALNKKANSPVKR